ncbi:alpha/beta fold hydrolase [Falsiroseomonas sp. HW251]|uniref:alpha/beta fold hydrolase n=1 Tax=Falsiroseomonas sp. HW251 TaxID=3390998 RepID=UPI003D31595C
MRILDELDREAARVKTPCGDGAMVWRIWNDGEVPLVMLHGGNGSWRHWVRQIERHRATRCLVAPDLPGLGESATPPEPHEPPHSARIVAEGLRRVLDGRRCDIVAFSFGAILSGSVAAEVGEAVRTLTVVGAGSLGVPRNPVPLEKIRDKQGEARIAAHRFNLKSLMIADPAAIDDLAVAIQEWNTVHARFRSRGFANATMLKDALARTRVPVTAIWGERDQIAVGHIEQRAAAVREVRPDARVEIVPRAGHWTMYEAPEAIDEALGRALAAAG